MSSTINGPQNACGNCGAQNASEDQYCAGCGLFLWEKCHGCNALVLLGQSFCNKCGTNLKEEFEKRLDEATSRLERVRVMAQEGRFSDAIKILKPNIEPADFRFKEVAAEAERLYHEFQRQRDHWAEQAPQLEGQAKLAVESNDYRAASELLQNIPKGVLSEEGQSLLDQTVLNCDLAKDAKASLKVALDQKDWETAVSDLVALIGLYPEKQKYRDLMTSVSDRVAKRTEKLIASGQHANALQELNLIPIEFQAGQHAKLRKALDDLLLARRIVASSPFATPLVSELIAYLKKTAKDETTVKLGRKLLSVKRSNSLYRFPDWFPGKNAQRTVFQDPIAPATLPANLNPSGLDALKNAGSTYWVALGLALQGIGVGQPTASLYAPKTGMLAKLSRKRAAPDLAWGMDIGDNQIKLVCVQKQGTDIQIIKAHTVPMGDGNIETSKPMATTVFKAFQKIASDLLEEGEAVVCNISPDLVLSRFIELPATTPEKKIEEFISQEAQANIPVRFEDLSMGYCVYDAPFAEAVSRQAVCFAPRKTDLDAHESLLRRAGVNVVAIVPEPIAYMNVFNAFDFFGEIVAEESDAILCVDVGAKRTSFVLCSKFGVWFRTINWGVDMISQAFAKSKNVTNKDAAAQRLKPLAGSLTDNFGILESSVIVPKREMERSIRAAKEQLGECRISRILLTGGGAFQPLLGGLLNGDFSKSDE